MFNTSLSEAVRPEPSPVRAELSNHDCYCWEFGKTYSLLNIKFPLIDSPITILFLTKLSILKEGSFIYLKHKVRVLLIKNNVTVIYQANPGPLFTSGK